MRRPEAPTWRGVHRTAHLWLDPPSRARVLRLWRAGAVLRELEGGWLLVLPAPIRVDARAAPGTVLQSLDGRAISAPLDRRTLAELPVGAVVLWRRGRPFAAAPETLPRVDPSRWVALLQPIATVRPLGEPPVVVPPPAAVSLDLRAQVPFGAAARDALANALSSVSAPSWLGSLQGAVGGAVGAVLGGAARAGLAIAGSSPTARSWLERLESVADAMGLHRALSAVVGAHNSRFLQKLVDQLDAGDWMTALASAIPLGGDAMAGPAGLAWLSALQGLRFRGAGSGRAGGVGAHPSLYERLRQLYERAFQALKAQGRVREAAYVKGELLGDVQGAVAYLEEVGEWRIAAELAETKQLDPALVVMLWLKAGEVERALVLAAARNGFGAAVEHLERRKLVAEAEALRIVWARREQKAGRSVAALAVAWPVERLRDEARGWLDDAVRAGGPGGARALAKSLAVRPTARDADRERLRELLAHDSVEARRALARALEDDPVSQRALRDVARKLVADCDALGTPAAATVAREVVARVKDGAFPADLPRLPSVDRPRAFPEAGVHHPVGAADTGTTELFDAIPLPRGRWLVAAGELGAWIVGPDGRRLRTFAAPTHRIVANAELTRALLVGRPLVDRAGLRRFRVARLGIPECLVEPWSEVAAHELADAYDGSAWFVLDGDRVIALDALAPGLRSLWEVRLDAPPRQLAWSPTALRVAVPLRAGVEVFRYELPSLTLRERREVLLPQGVRWLTLAAEGVLLSTPRAFESVTQAGAVVARVPLEDCGRVWQGAGAIGAVVETPGELVGVVTAGLAGRPLLRLGLGERPHGRVTTTPDGDPVLVGVDADGRLRAVDLRDGALVADLRV